MFVFTYAKVSEIVSLNLYSFGLNSSSEDTVVRQTLYDFREKSDNVEYFFLAHNVILTKKATRVWLFSSILV